MAGLFDFIFQRSKKPVTQAAGVTGATSYAGKLISFETSPDLQGTNLYTTYTNMVANTVIVGACVRYYQNLLGGTAWTVTPKEGSGSQGQAAADLVKDGLFESNMTTPWFNVVKRAALYRMFGFSIHEWTMRKRADGKMVFADISHRPQQTIQFWDIPDDGSSFVGVVQRPLLAGQYYYIPRDRMFYNVDSSLTDQPDGVGMLRHIVEHTRRLGRYEQLEGFAYESDLRGIPVGRIPYRELEKYAKANGYGKTWIDKQVAAMESLVENHIRTPWLGITVDSSMYVTDAQNQTISSAPQWHLDLLKGGNYGLAEITEVVERLNREIARVLGMEFMMLGGDGKGSLALSRDKTSMFASVLEASLHELAWQTTHDLVWPLLKLNNIDPEKYAPQVQPDPIATERIETTVDAILKLAQAGAILMPDDPVINQIRQRLHLAAQPKLPPEIINAGLPPRGSAGKPGVAPPKPGTGDDSVDVDVSDLGGDGKGGRATAGNMRQPKERATSKPSR